MKNIGASWRISNSRVRKFNDSYSGPSAFLIQLRNWLNRFFSNKRIDTLNAHKPTFDRCLIYSNYEISKVTRSYWNYTRSTLTKNAFELAYARLVVIPTSSNKSAVRISTWTFNISYRIKSRGRNGIRCARRFYLFDVSFIRERFALHAFATDR